MDRVLAHHVERHGGTGHGGLERLSQRAPHETVDGPTIVPANFRLLGVDIDGDGVGGAREEEEGHRAVPARRHEVTVGLAQGMAHAAIPHKRPLRYTCS